ncbi:MAG: cysteine hydrolase family protein [Burkholderiaceae bacterium]|nr:cysteine hydrolase family protein [Burkholderiaceae bacterium]
MNAKDAQALKSGVAGAGLNRIGSVGAHNHWLVNEKHVDLVGTPVAPAPVTIQSDPQTVTFDAHRTALIVIDMQNDFCAKDGWVDHLGVDYTPCRQPIEPLQKLLPVLRDAKVPIIWVNWGNRPDLLNMPPNQHHLYKPKGSGIGLGEQLPTRAANVLEKDSWAAAVVDELKIHPQDISVDKYRISGFWDTPLDSILRNMDIKTLMFAGVNTDQCVLCSLQDANFLGYACIMVEDCCATTSPEFCTQNAVFNVKKCFGFVTNSDKIIAGFQEK